jgi:tRNA-binding protein
LIPSVEPDVFFRAALRAGTIVSAEPFPEARKPAYRLIIDFGPSIGLLKSSAQITQNYQTDELIGTQVIAVVNFPPKKIGPLLSQCLVLAVTSDQEGTVLLHPGRPVTDGSPVS